MKKNKANQSASPKTSRINNASPTAQRDRLEAWLEKCAVDTLYARDELNNMQAAALFKELREAGHPIKTQRITITDAQCRTHRGIALHYLSSEESPMTSPDCPAIYRLKGAPPHIDNDSLWLLLAIQSDLIRFARGEQDGQRAAELCKINARLSGALARFEPPKGAA